MLFSSVLGVLGGITVFMLGLKFVGGSMGRFVTGRLSDLVYKATSNPFSAVGIGAAVTSVAQSSVAINFVLVSLVDGGAVPFIGACAVVIGTNVGTTVTAQLTSLSFGTFDMSAVGALLAFSGFLLSSVKHGKISVVGDIILGFGLVFIGIKMLTDGMENFYGYEWFRTFFLIDDPCVLILNGFMITALCQSSSVVSSMLVILSSGGLIGFENAVFLILGANIGTTVCVMVFSANKSLAARRTAFFNFLFNVVGALVFCVCMAFFGEKVSAVFTGTASSAGRAVANFHTFFNLVSGIITLPVLRPLASLCSLIIKDNQSKSVRKRVKKTPEMKKIAENDMKTA